MRISRTAHWRNATNLLSAATVIALLTPSYAGTGDCPVIVVPDPKQLVGSTSVFTIDQFENLIYMDGFTGTVGETETWPAEMGWQGDRIDIQFQLPPDVPPDALYYAFSMVITHQFDQEFDVSIQVGPNLAELEQIHIEFVDSPRTLLALIPLCQFEPGQSNWIRIQGIGVQVGFGQPPGIQWDYWTLKTVAPTDIGGIRTDQLGRLTNYIQDAIQPSGLVRDSLMLSPNDANIHPASPDAAGFAILGLCAADYLDLIPDAAELVQSILDAYAGNAPGVTPARSADGHWQHFLNLETGEWAGAPWEFCYTPIGSALLVSAAQFASNHFIEDPDIVALAEELTISTNFNQAIHPSLDGRVFLCMEENGGGDEGAGQVLPWNEFMLVVSLALREQNNKNAQAVQHLWLEPKNLPIILYEGIPTLTDNPNNYAPAFWVQQSHFFNTDFATDPDFETFFVNQQLADQLYCSTVLGEEFRYGLTAGVIPGGYDADRIEDHNFVFSPEAVTAWGDLETMAQFYAEQSPPDCNPRYRYGLVRVSSLLPNWIPTDAGLVDHLFLMFGLVESIDPLFFLQRLPGQPDADSDGIADEYDNCPDVFNPGQADENGDGVGDVCEPIPGDLNGDGVVGVADLLILLSSWGPCKDCGDCSADIDGNCVVGVSDLLILLANWG